MASSGKETTYSMGDDAPMAVLSECVLSPPNPHEPQTLTNLPLSLRRRPHPITSYFKQRFAQVTNPPIDPLREGVVMSLAMTLGKKASIYKVSEEGARIIKLDSPLLNPADMDYIRSLSSESNGGFVNEAISTRYPLSAGPSGLEPAVQALCDAAVTAVRPRERKAERVRPNERAGGRDERSGRGSAPAPTTDACSALPLCSCSSVAEAGRITVVGGGPPEPPAVHVLGHTKS
jgi:glutamate synthase (ferredoxin)